MFGKIDYAMVMVSHMERSVKFYRDTLGFKLRFQSEEWTEFETGGTTLALHGGAVPDPDRKKGGPAQSAGTVSLGLSVTGIDAVVRALKGLGVIFVMEPVDRKDEGIRLAVFLDPDGMAISLAEPLNK